MSHAETSGTATRKERRKAYGNNRNRVVPRPFKASDHVREDWSPYDVAELLERRAHGYNGRLRSYLCTAAHHIRVAGATIDRLEDELLAAGAVVVAEVAVPAPAVSKRNQQPGRLSGGEREALKNLVTDLLDGELSREEAMAEGRKMLTKVRKRALGSDQELDPPIGFKNVDEVPSGLDPETLVDDVHANYAAFGPDGDPS